MVSKSGLVAPPPWDEGLGLVVRRKRVGESNLRLNLYLERRGLVQAYVSRGALIQQPYWPALDIPSLTYFTFYWSGEERIKVERWEPRRLYPTARQAPILLLEWSFILLKTLPPACWDREIFLLSLRLLHLLERGLSPSKVRLTFLIKLLETLGYGIEVPAAPWSSYISEIKKGKEVPEKVRKGIERLAIDTLRERLDIELREI